MEEDADRRRSEPTIETTYLEQISVAQVSDFIRERVQRSGIQAKTANRHREVLRRLFSWSMEEGGVRMPSDVNPAAKVKRYQERAPEIRFLTLEQIDHQLEVLANEVVIHAMVATYIYAGLRREEALWLTIEDVDFHMGRHGTIAVRAKLVDGEFWEPKTKVNRIVPVSRALRTHLDRYLETFTPGYWFFPSPRGKRWHPDNFSEALRASNKEAGLAWSCLDFRHTFGSQLAMKGESLYKIATLMGNSPEVCRKHYAALMPESLVQCVEFDSELPGER
jgi:integrase